MLIHVSIPKLIPIITQLPEILLSDDLPQKLEKIELISIDHKSITEKGYQVIISFFSFISLIVVVLVRLTKTILKLLSYIQVG